VTTEPEPRKRDWRWLMLTGVAVLVLGVAAVLWFNRAAPTAQPSPASTTTQSSTTPAPAPSASEEPASPSATPSPASTKKQSPYCRAFTRITAGGLSTSSDDGSVDFDELSNKFADLIKKYSAAAALAPPSLDEDYAQVLVYLRQGKRAVDSRNLDQIKAMVRNLSSLNSTMENIQTESEELCR